MASVTLKADFNKIQNHFKNEVNWGRVTRIGALSAIGVGIISALAAIILLTAPVSLPILAIKSVIILTGVATFVAIGFIIANLILTKEPKRTIPEPQVKENETQITLLREYIKEKEAEVAEKNKLITKLEISHKNELEVLLTQQQQEKKTNESQAKSRDDYIAQLTRTHQAEKEELNKQIRRLTRKLEKSALTSSTPEAEVKVEAKPAQVEDKKKTKKTNTPEAAAAKEEVEEKKEEKVDEAKNEKKSRFSFHLGKKKPEAVVEKPEEKKEAVA